MAFEFKKTRLSSWIDSKLSNDSIPSTLFYVGLTIFITAIISAIASYIVYRGKFSGEYSDDANRWGLFGDYFGGTLGPFFSLLSLLAILITLFLQSRELASSNKALEDQSDLMQLQTFESIFFSMLSLCAEHINNIDLSEEEDSSFTGKKATRKLYKRLTEIYAAERRNNPTKPEEDLIKSSYRYFIDTNEHHLGSLVNTLHQTFELIDNRARNCPEVYWKTLRAQLSSHELTLIFYHSLVMDDFASREHLIKNKFFELIGERNLLNIELHKYLVK